MCPLSQGTLLEEVSGPAGRRLRQQLAGTREQLQAILILVDRSSDSEAAAPKDKSMADMFALAARVAKRSDTVLAIVQTSVRQHMNSMDRETEQIARRYRE